MSDGERIIEIINYLKLTKRQFAMSIGYPTGDVVYNIEKGKSKLNRKLVDKITTKYPVINKAWLLTGEGEMLIKGNPSRDQEGNPDKFKKEIKSLEEKVDYMRKCINMLEEKVDYYESGCCDKVKKPSKLSEKSKEQKTKEN